MAGLSNDWLSVLEPEFKKEYYKQLFYFVKNEYETKFEKYDITHVIVMNNSKLNMFISRNDDYEQIYNDDYFSIYERNVD